MLYKTNCDEFCKRLIGMSNEQTLDFAIEAEEDENGNPIPDTGSGWFGVKRMHLFDCDRFIIASYGGNPEFVITANGCPSEPYEYLWDDIQRVFADIFDVKHFNDDLVVFVEEKSDAELVEKILQKYGWQTEATNDGFNICDGVCTVNCVLQVSPDAEDDTDFFAYSRDNATDGHLSTFTSGHPEAHEIEIIEAVKSAFTEEHEHQLRKENTP